MAREPTLGEMMNRTARLLRRLADHRLAPLGLSSGYLPVLTALMPGEALSQKALTEHAGIEQPTMAATLSRMERDGVIAREPYPGDKRSARFSLTPATRGKLGAITSAIERMNEDALAPLADADRASLRDMLHAVIGAVQRARDVRACGRASRGRRYRPRRDCRPISRCRTTAGIIPARSTTRLPDRRRCT